jgi:Tol biopolymer transport system component
LRQAIDGFTWTTDNEIVYPRANELIARTIDGNERPVFVSDPNSPPRMPDVCRDDGSIVFIWPFRDGTTNQNVWRIKADGTEPRPVTNLRHTIGPACSPDGQWVAFHAATQTYSVPRNGGVTVLLSKTPPFSNVAFSPDGKWAAVIAAVSVRDGRLEQKLTIMAPDGSNQKLLHVAGGRVIRFTVDGSGLASIVRKDNADNIQVARLDGSSSRLITAFTSGRIAGFRWSPDGSKLAVQRQRRDSDVVLLRDGDEDR